MGKLLHVEKCIEAAINKHIRKQKAIAAKKFNHYHGAVSIRMPASTKCRHLTRLANVGKDKCMAGAWLKKHKFFAWYPHGKHGVCWSSPICGVGISGGRLVKSLGATAYKISTQEMRTNEQRIKTKKQEQ